jgi:hypothetical protein
VPVSVVVMSMPIVIFVPIPMMVFITVMPPRVMVIIGVMAIVIRIGIPVQVIKESVEKREYWLIIISIRIVIGIMYRAVTIQIVIVIRHVIVIAGPVKVLPVNRVIICVGDAAVVP